LPVAFDGGLALQSLSPNGGDGNDVALMGAGDDTFVWNPGDDNDTLEGQSASGAQTRSSRRGFVFVEEAAEEVAPPDLQRMKGRRVHAIGSAAANRRPQVERSVWALLVEVADCRRGEPVQRVSRTSAAKGGSSSAVGDPAGTTGDPTPRAPRRPPSGQLTRAKEFTLSQSRSVFRPASV
jgi:hypothetical protein